MLIEPKPGLLDNPRAMLGIMGCVAAAYVIYYAATAENRKMEALIKQGLPESVYSQQEFPPEKIHAMMRACLVHEKKGIERDEQRYASLCGCLTAKRIEQYTPDEYRDASAARWNPKTVPEAVAKNSAIEHACVHAMRARNNDPERVNATPANQVRPREE